VVNSKSQNPQKPVTYEKASFSWFEGAAPAMANYVENNVTVSVIRVRKIKKKQKSVESFSSFEFACRRQGRRTDDGRWKEKEEKLDRL
jgi:hypothetical protein